MKTLGMIAVLTLTLTIAGCGGPPARLDTTSEATTLASMRKMTEGMSEDRKKAFAMECAMLTIGDVMRQSMAAEKGKPIGAAQAFRSLNGLTADEIHTRVVAINDARK